MVERRNGSGRGALNESWKVVTLVVIGLYSVLTPDWAAGVANGQEAAA
jgi:hypothetical protein